MGRQATARRSTTRAVRSSTSTSSTFFRTNGGGDEIARLEKTLDRLDQALPGLLDSLSLSIVVRLPNGKYRNITEQEILVD